jgi:quercetin dioxygenase-like cupin family protein
MKGNEGKFLMPTEGDGTWFSGNLYVTKVGRRESAPFSIIEETVAASLGAPVHRHTRESEAWYVLDGALAVQLGDRRIDAPARSFFFVPRGVRHGYTNRGPETARALIIISPGGLEGFFEEGGERAATNTLPPPPKVRPDLERLIAMGRKYNIDTVEPVQFVA